MIHYRARLGQLRCPTRAGLPTLVFVEKKKKKLCHFYSQLLIMIMTTPAETSTIEKKLRQWLRLQLPTGCFDFDFKATRSSSNLCMLRQHHSPADC